MFFVKLRNVSRETCVVLSGILRYYIPCYDTRRSKTLAKIIAIANQKGGVGKTTTNVNLSTCVAQKSKRVLVIDIDPQGNTTSGFGIDRDNVKHSVYDVLVSDMPINEARISTQVEGLDLVATNIELAGAEIELVSMMARERILRNALEDIRDEYDYIFIDCPPSLGLLTLNALTAADTVLVPIQCEYYALEGLSQLMNTIKLVRRNLNPSLDVEGVVLTMFDARTNLSSQVVAEIKKFFKNKVYKTVIPRSIRLGEAPSFGKPITLYDIRSSGALAYISLCDELLNNNEGGKE